MIGSDALLRTDWDHPVTAPGHRTQPCGNAPCAGWLPQRFLGHILGHHSAPIRTANTWHMLPGCCNPAQRNPRCCELGVTRGTLCTGSSPPGCLQQLRRGCGGSAGCTCPHPQLPAAHGSEQSNILRHPPRAQNPPSKLLVHRCSWGAHPGGSPDPSAPSRGPRQLRLAAGAAPPVPTSPSAQAPGGSAHLKPPCVPQPPRAAAAPRCRAAAPHLAEQLLQVPGAGGVRVPVEVRAQAVEALQQLPVPPRLAAAEGSVAAAEGEAPRRAERRLEVQALRVRPGRARAQRRRQQQRQRRPRPAQRPHPPGRRRGPRSGRAALGSLARPRHGTARPAPRGSACPGLPPAPAAAEGAAGGGVRRSRGSGFAPLESETRSPRCLASAPAAFGGTRALLLLGLLWCSPSCVAPAVDVPCEDAPRLRTVPGVLAASPQHSQHETATSLLHGMPLRRAYSLLLMFCIPCHVSH